MTRRIETVAELRGLVGQEIGASGWIAIEQARIDQFAEATDDRQYIHIDPARAKAEGPFGGTVAHGYLTLSLLPRIFAEAFLFVPKKTGINYGLDRVRFMSPVPAGSRIRGHVTLAALDEPVANTLQLKLAVTIEVEGVGKPACVAEPVVRYLV